MVAVRDAGRSEGLFCRSGSFGGEGIGSDRLGKLDLHAIKYGIPDFADLLIDLITICDPVALTPRPYYSVANAWSKNYVLAVTIEVDALAGAQTIHCLLHDGRFLVG